ncbi:hypothetical protein F9K33_11315 [bacterium]|nr:MAG: hypothetical protein F9K33_11315 [bacterium]
MKNYYVLIMFCGALWTSAFAQEKKSTIAVLNFVNSGGVDQNEISILTDRFNNYLVNTDVYTVLEREKMDAILKAQDFTMTDNCNSAECAIQIGQLLGVELMVAGKVGQFGQVYTIDIRIIDVTTGKIVRTKSENYEGKKEGLLDMIEALAYTVSGKTAPAKTTTKTLTDKNSSVSTRKTVDESGGVSAEKSEMPEWLSRSGLYGNIFVGVGVGESTDAQKAIIQAEENGREYIEEMIQTYIKNLTTSFIEEVGTIDDRNKIVVAKEYFEKIKESITNTVMKNSAAEDYWPPYTEKPQKFKLSAKKKSDTKFKFYAKVVLKKESLVDEFKKKVQSDIAKKRIKAVKASAEDALKALDKAIGKWEQSPN